MNQIFQNSLIEEKNHKQQIDREAVLERCRDLALSKSVLSILSGDLQNHGFAGPTNIPLIVFLAAYTRMLPKPVSLVIKGPSASGKSFSLHAGLRYLPGSAYEEFHGLSEKALVYAHKLNLKHRCLVIQEAAGLAEGNGRTFLRQLLSEGRVRYMTVQNTKDGNVGQELPTIEGPVSLMMTTTANSLHWEDETRMLTLHSDQSSDQIRKALLAKLGGGPTSPKDEDLSRWHALHDFVVSGPMSVIIPYEKSLLSSLPSSHQRVLRDADHVLALIRAHALMHQCTRNDHDGHVVANIDDYAAVHSLIAEPLSQGLDRSIPPHIHDVSETVGLSFDARGQSISVTELANILRKEVGVVSRNVQAAIRLGYLDNLNPGQGKTAALVPGKRELPKGTVLPSRETLLKLEKIDDNRCRQS